MSGGATTPSLLAAFARHRLTPVEWALLALLLADPFRLHWHTLLRDNPTPFTASGLRKGLQSLEARGWVQVRRYGYTAEVQDVFLLPLVVASSDRQRADQVDATAVARGHVKPRAKHGL